MDDTLERRARANKPSDARHAAMQKIANVIGGARANARLCYNASVAGKEDGTPPSWRLISPGTEEHHGVPGGSHHPEGVGAADPIPDDLLFRRLSRSRQCR